MDKKIRSALLVLRLAMGWLFLYAGLVKVFDSSWSAAGYLNNAQTFPGLFAWFASEGNIGWINFVNEWGLTLIGVALILGVWVRWVSVAGIALMMLYFFPVLNFPKVGDHSFIVDDHIIYALVLAVFAVMNPESNGFTAVKKFFKAPR